MYGKMGTMSPAVVAGSTLPFTGLNIAWTIVAVATLAFVGFAILRLVPKSER